MESSKNAQKICFNREADARAKRRQKNEKYRREKNLPIYAHKERIMNSISQNKFTIVVGETGCGKSTQMPQYLFEYYEEIPGSKILWVLPRKLATTTLAQRVCEEMGLTLGKDIDYELPSRKKIPNETLLRFITDTVLIRELIQAKLNGQINLNYSIIVLDEVHERNLYTDVLLAILKTVALESNMKLLVTSATINEALFETYFGVQAIKINLKPYPVDFEYRPIPEGVDKAHYMANTISYVTKTMKSGELGYQGHILVFTSGINQIMQITEVLEELEKIDSNKFIILPLHGLLSPEEQRAIFKDYNGKIKIILSTRMAETALTINGVCVVIDIGVDKEERYDSMKKITITETKFIPQSSAIQRAGRAGRTKKGLCIRLYSEDDFGAMEKTKKPEIKRMNLSKAVLKLKAIGVKEIRKFDFIEKPDNTVLEQTIEHLELLGALNKNDETLTSIGKEMLNFETEPDFARAILEGKSKNCMQEVATIVAMITVSPGLSKRGIEPETQEKAKKKKWQFCHWKGDLLTLLGIFESWMTIPSYRQKQWCRENFLGFSNLCRALEIYEDLTKGYKNIIYKNQYPSLGESTNPSVKERISEKSEKENTIIKCFLKVFFPNLVEYTGVPKIGYNLLRDFMNLKVHGASSLALLQEYPKLLICIDINSTEYNYSKIVTTVKKEWIDEVLPGHQQNPKLEYLNLSYSSRQHVECNIGKHVLGYFVNDNLRKIEEEINKRDYLFIPDFPEEKLYVYDNLRKIKEEINNPDYLFIPDFPEEKLYVYSPNKSQDNIKEVSQELIQKIKEVLDNEVREFEITLRTRCILEKGAKVRKIFLDRGTCCLRFEGFNQVYDNENLKIQLSEIADVTEVSSEIDPATNLRFGYIKTQTIQDVVKLLEYYTPKRMKEDFGNLEGAIAPLLIPTSIKSNDPFIKKALRVKMTWFVEGSINSARLYFNNSEDAKKAYDGLIEQKIEIDGKPIHAESKAKKRDLVIKTPKKNTCTLELINLTPTTDKTLIRKILQNNGVDQGLCSCRLFKAAKPFLPSVARRTMLDHLMAKFHTDMLKISIPDYRNQNFSHRNCKRWIDLDVFDVDVAKRLVKYFNNKNIFNGVPLECSISYCRKIKMKKDNYKTIKDEISTIINKTDESVKIFVDARDFITYDYQETPGAIIFIFAEDPPTVDKWYDIVSQVAKGTPFQLQSNEDLKKAEFQSTLDKIEKIKKKYHVSVDLEKKRGTFYIFGKKETRKKAFEALKDIFEKNNDLFEEKICFRYHSIRKLLDNMENLFNQLNKDHGVHIHLSFLNREIKISGQKEDVCEAKKEVEKHISKKEGTTSNECPICCEEYVEGYRLQICSHKFCYICIQKELKQMIDENPKFPLLCSQCLAEGQQTAICLRDLWNILKSDLITGYQKSIKSYVNEKSYFECYSPDCPQIFVKSEDRCFSCDYCYRSYCKNCKEESHEEEDCEKASKKLLKARLLEKGCKECPGCKMMIEKNGGCHKMKCTSCKTMFCWLCKKVDSDEQKIYHHLMEVHGKIGDEDPGQL